MRRSMTQQARSRARYPDVWPGSSPIRSSTFLVRARPWYAGLGCRSDFGTLCMRRSPSSPPRQASARRRCLPPGSRPRPRTTDPCLGVPRRRPTTSPCLLVRRGDGVTPAAPTAGKALPLVEGPQPPSAVVVTSLANELGSLGSDVPLVLDDFHVIDATDLHDQVSFLFECLPPSAHIVIATRADPPFPLAR